MKIPSNSLFFSKRLDLLLGRLSRSRLKTLRGTDPEALHDFRVALRRLRACLGLLEGGYPARVVDPILSALKKLAEDTNALRDLDVYSSLWKSLPPVHDSSPAFDRWLGTQDEIRGIKGMEVLVALSSPDLERWISGLGKKLAWRRPPQKTVAMMEGPFQRERRKLEKLLKKAKLSKKQNPLLHHLRLQAKRVRYSLEEFPFLLPGRAGELAAGCKKVQEALGDWRDSELALGILKRAGNGLFREIRPWVKALKARRAAAQKKSRKALRGLRRALE